MKKNTVKSIVDEGKEIQRAIELIKLGARLQVLETETRLSRERLLRLYKEIHHKSPPKGMLPFSTDWFMTWQPNVHSSLFMNIYEFLNKNSELDEADLIIKGYKLYLEQIAAHKMAEVLSLTRAWRLVKFFDAGMLTLTGCKCCRGHFVVHTFELTKDYVCGLCHMPSRAGKTVAARNAQAEPAPKLPEIAEVDAAESVTSDNVTPIAAAQAAKQRPAKGSVRRPIPPTIRAVA